MAGGRKWQHSWGRVLGILRKPKITLSINHSHPETLLHEVADIGSFDEGVDALSFAWPMRNMVPVPAIPVLILTKRKTITIAELRDEKGELLVPERKNRL